MRIFTSEDAVSLIKSGNRIAIGGFGSCGHPDSLTKALRRRFLKTGKPRNLRLLFAAGAGDRMGRGLDQLALEGLIAEAVGGFWGLSPALGHLAQTGQIAAHLWPQGVISALFSEIAAHRPGLVTKIGLGTFVDPVVDGGVLDRRIASPLVKRLQIGNQDYLLYPSLPIDIALLRGSFADNDGNIYFDDEVSYMDALAQATAARNSGGQVIVQVKGIIERKARRPSDVRVPGLLVDYLVIGREDEHPQTYGVHHEPSFVGGEINPSFHHFIEAQSNPVRDIIAKRASRELTALSQCHANLGIGIPALIAWTPTLSSGKGTVLSVESGLLGGRPAEGLSFGASSGPTAVIEQSSMFNFYDGGGIDIAFLGFAEVDKYGNVNTSFFGGRLQGPGGFINISQSAKRLVFCGSLTGEISDESTKVNRAMVTSDNRIIKFVQNVSHLTFNSSVKAANSVKYVTESCVFDLVGKNLVLVEINSGVSIDYIKAMVDIEFSISPQLSLSNDFC